eukprot:gene12833-7183_t
MPRFKNSDKEIQEDVITEWKCKHCGSTDIIEDHAAGDMVCTNCGFVVGDRIVDVEKEWREFESDPDSRNKSRVGGPMNPLIESSQLSTTIQKTEGGKLLSKTQLRSTISGQDRSLMNAFKKIDAMCEKIDLPQKFKTKSQEVYKQMEEAKSVRGRNSEALIAACIYTALRLEKSARTLKEICALTNVGKKEIGKCYKLILNTLQLDVETITHTDYMNRFCSYLNLSKKVQKYSEIVSQKATTGGLVAGRSPITVAAAAIFLVASILNERKSQKEIAEVTGVSEPTIRNCVKDLEQEKELILPTQLIDEAKLINPDYGIDEEI